MIPVVRRWTSVSPLFLFREEKQQPGREEANAIFERDRSERDTKEAARGRKMDGACIRPMVLGSSLYREGGVRGYREA